MVFPTIPMSHPGTFVTVSRGQLETTTPAGPFRKSVGPAFVIEFPVTEMPVDNVTFTPYRNRVPPVPPSHLIWLFAMRLLIPLGSELYCVRHRCHCRFRPASRRDQTGHSKENCRICPCINNGLEPH